MKDSEAMSELTPFPPQPPYPHVQHSTLAIFSTIYHKLSPQMYLAYKQQWQISVIYEL